MFAPASSIIGSASSEPGDDLQSMRSGVSRRSSAVIITEAAGSSVSPRRPPGASFDIDRILAEGYAPGRELPAAEAKLDTLGELEREELSLKIERARAAVPRHVDGLLQVSTAALHRSWRTVDCRRLQPACAGPEPVVAAIRALDDLTVQLSDGGAGGNSKGDFAANIASIIRSHPQLGEDEKDALIW